MMIPKVSTDCRAVWSHFRSIRRLQGGKRAYATVNADNLSSMFAFVKDVEHNTRELIDRSRETLRSLGKGDDHIRLQLPASLDENAPKSPLGRTAFIDIHNTSARNALSGKMMADFADIVTQLEDPQIQNQLSAIVLRGSGGWFCAGADIRIAKKEMSSRAAGTAMGALMVDTLTRFRRLPMISVAVVEGGAFGGGAELATACDFRMINKNAVIQFVQSRMGVSPGWGGGARLYKIVGRQQALRLLCTAEKLSPTRAMEIGFIDAIIDSDIENVENAINAFVAPFDATTPEVLHGAKRIVTNADDVSLDEMLAYEHNIFKTLWGGPANLQALENALKKKKN